MAPHLSESEQTTFACVFAVIAVVGVLGNLLVILAIGTDRKMRRSVMNLVLLNLAVADLFNLITCAPDIIMAIIGEGWILPDILCPILRYFEEIFLYASLLMQLSVCVERFIAISMPMRVHILCTQKKFLILAACLWLLSAVYAIPYGFHVVDRTPPNQTMEEDIPDEERSFYCGMDHRLFPGFKYAEFLSFYLLPLIVTLILYGRISFILWSSNRHLHEGSSIMENSSSETLRTRKNVVKMLIACVAQYFIAYSPIQGLFLLEAIGVHYMPPFSALLVLNALAYSCSATNPILYTIFSQKFRAKFLQFILFWDPERRRNSEASRSNQLFTDESKRSFRRSHFEHDTYNSPFLSSTLPRKYTSITQIQQPGNCSNIFSNGSSQYGGATTALILPMLTTPDEEHSCNFPTCDEPSCFNPEERCFTASTGIFSCNSGALISRGSSSADINVNINVNVSLHNGSTVTTTTKAVKSKSPFLVIPRKPK